jgi:endoglucanase
MGATNKDNLQDRIAWFDYFVTEGRKNGVMTCCLWDNGVWKINPSEPASKKFSEHYGYYNRNEQTWFFPELHETAIKAMKK